MSQPLVSVIVPCYNMSAFLEETLRSIVASDYRPLEVLVTDDGSTDDSLSVANTFAAQHPEVRVISQPNSGVSAARNNAIRHAKGDYILPVDADNLITPDYVRLAAAVLDTHPEVLAVGCEAEFFGARTGRWKLPPFSLRLLARKNMIDTCAMYRRTDWERVGGYDESFPIREDWTFWLAVFANGGEFYRLPRTCLHYRIRESSKRTIERQHKRALVDHVNQRFPDFLQRYLGGPLHYHRSWSRFLNFFRREKTVSPLSIVNFPRLCQSYEASPHSKADRPSMREKNKELSTRSDRPQERIFNNRQVLHSGRNTLYEQDGLVIKQFAKPGLLKALYYGWFGKSKARRSYEYAQRLLSLGIATPEPVAYQEVRYFGLLRDSYYVCRKSACPYSLSDLIPTPSQKEMAGERPLPSIASFIARMHEAGILHRDLSPGNILFDDKGQVEVIDLNRICWKRQPLDFRTGCQNFERLNIGREALTIMAKAYAEARGFEPDTCVRYILTHRWYKHVRQGITNL